MDNTKPVVKKALLIALLSALGLTGCVAVPAYDPYYGPPAVAAPTVVVRPYGYYGYYNGYHHRHWR